MPSIFPINPTHFSLSSMLGFVFIATMVLVLFGFFAIIWTMIFKTKVLYMVRPGEWRVKNLNFPQLKIYCALGTLLFMVYLAIDIQVFCLEKSELLILKI